MQVPPIEAAAIEQFALSISVPIFLDVGASGELRATGTLFKIAGRYFLITARHVFDDLPDLTKLAVAESPLSGGIFTLGDFMLLKPTEEHVDVAAIEFKSMETIVKFERNWKFLSLENVASAYQVTGDATFFVSGYPSSLIKREASLIKGKFVTAYTQRLYSPPAEAIAPVSPELDMFFDYARDATLLTGEVVETPKLPGVSGASVWAIRAVSGVWSPEAAIRVVGIQSAYLHSKYIRVKSWLAVAKMLESADHELADAIRAKLHEI